MVSFLKLYSNQRTSKHKSVYTSQKTEGDLNFNSLNSFRSTDTLEMKSQKHRIISKKFLISEYFYYLMTFTVFCGMIEQ